MRALIRVTAIVTVSVVLSHPAMAMNCGEFLEMSEDGRKGVVMGVMVEREAAGGREAAREAATGADKIYAGTVEICQSNSEKDFMEALDAMHPGAGN
ncbi:HdeA/HdeB family chaperone [Roseovarius arcticus]|uniref:HdeA/HdeB family chaperone n=1 Tax=Roseovarius arcticus TaxID=2547404 RepID=UPI001110C075|nr:HdeA/HdeB family chaperone [Roseovarius arcticus]